MIIDIAQRPNVTEQEVMENNERYLFSVAQRTMSLPLGRFGIHRIYREINRTLYPFLEVLLHLEQFMHHHTTLLSFQN